MDQHEESESGFIPDAYDRPAALAKANGISAARGRWRVPAVVTTMAVVAALCLHDGSHTHQSAAPKAAAVSGLAAVQAKGGVSAYGLANMAEDTDDSSGSTGGSTSGGGMHGAFNLYDGVGGGIEFWFDPGTGDLTVAIGAGIGEGGGGVLGTYKPGSVPEPGAYVYINADLGEGSVVTTNVSGLYSLSNGNFVGSFNTTVDGRTLSIASDGGATFDVNVNAAEGAEGFTGAVGVNYTFKFNWTDFVNVIWDAIKDLFTGDYFLEDDDEDYYDTWEYEDDSSTDDDSELTTTTDDSTDDDTATVSDDSSDDSSSDAAADDASDDSGDDGGDGGGGGGDDGCDEAETESISLSYVADDSAVHTAPSTSQRTQTAVIVPVLEEPADDGECD